VRVGIAMGRCTKGSSQCVLLVTNTLIFIISGAALGVTIYIFLDAVAKSLTKVNLLTVVGVASIALMIFAILGCCAALTPPQKKCSKCCYLTILLVLFLAEFVAAGYVFNLGHALEVANDKGFNVQGGVDKAAEDAVVFLHDQLESLYNDEHCQGGSAKGSALPLNFTKVTCNNQKVTDAFKTILQDPSITTKQELSSYNNCTTDTRMSSSGKPNDFTQAFCGSETHIVSLARKYSKYLVWFPVALAGLTFILLVSTICLIAQKNQQRHQQIRLQRGQEPLHRVQMAGP